MARHVEQPNETRRRRAELWLGHAENEKGEGDVGKATKFIFYWIAFESAYGESEYGKSLRGEGRLGVKNELARFIDKVTEGKEDKFINLFKEVEEPILVIINLPQTHKKFWKLDGKSYPKWTTGFWSDKRQIEEGTTEDNIKDILSTVFYRLYTVRNQIMHGASSGVDSLGKTQVEASIKILEKFIPEFIAVMRKKMENEILSWGNVKFPRVSNDDVKHLLHQSNNPNNAPQD